MSAILRPMKILITLLKPFSFAPAILMMCVIFSFSSQTGEVSGALSYKISYQIVETKNEILASGKSPEQLSQEASSIEFYVRKAAHMTEYCLLAISISFPLYVYGVRGVWLMLLAGIICVAFAGTDEYHQSFVDARGPSVRDVCIDSTGSLIGTLLVQTFCWSTLHTPGRKQSRKKKRNSRKRK
ncbi:VanZ family protein [Blautia sp. CLA-JM-H16]|uniref:VanZ family protein n=1 Tax=Blautia aquisgranensis TaxID=3133153 RepID=A0ABV1BFY8_9FIRM